MTLNKHIKRGTKHKHANDRRNGHEHDAYSHMSPEDIKAISDLIDAKIKSVRVYGKPPKRGKHWKRRLVLSVVVLGVATVTHHVIEHTQLRQFLQAAELGFAAIFDSLFTIARGSDNDEDREG